MVSASPRPSFLADLLQLGKKTDTSTPVPHPLYCFPSPPDQHSLKGLGRHGCDHRLPVFILPLGNRERICWASSLCWPQMGSPDALRLCSPDVLGETGIGFSVSQFPLHRCLATFGKHLDS